MSDFLDIPDADVPSDVIVASEPSEEMFAAAPAVPAAAFEMPPAAFEMPQPEVEDALAVFNRAWAEKLEQKRQEEAAHDQNARNQGVSDLSNWNAQRSVRLAAKKDKNRSEEQVLLESIEYELESGNTWERVTKMIDNEPTPSSSADSAVSDTGRMRKLFIQLKNEPLDSTRQGK